MYSGFPTWDYSSPHSYLQRFVCFIFCRTYCCILRSGNMPREKSNTLGSCMWLHYYEYCLSEWRKGVFPATLATTSWKPPSAFPMVRSQRDLKAGRALHLGKGWEQSSPIERIQVKHNWCQRPADSITDEPGTHQRRKINRHHHKKHRREKQSVLSQWKMAK